ncbi:sugar ABC transporter substrate-binding protein [Truepera radiovictrix]|uniref:Sugar ABC transporter n=1 Tax=Truepera radiovictrix (strain DSM 17093 / CIP 108686 / LMG 22925 / RQ-24) TaxID=649638 RepID=D7CWG0_TRURR|nr:sugar ABC transporter substrate-binding protein [Truepera radiovictrix]ADI14359.1 sugar ABC transporter [Truepera radiovictrix DSM 17093]WMT57084.1 sugar ABC transporter substrate-binding protein [Truepera radiovictrix]
MKRFAAPLLLMGAALCAAQEAPAREDIRIVVVTHGTAADPFWSVASNGVQQAARDMGVSVEYRAPETFDMPRMSQLIDAAVASQPDGLVVSIPDAEALGDAIGRAVDAGIPVISMNSGSEVFEELGVLRHVGQTEYEAGFGAGERMAEAGVSAAICVNHEVGNVGLDERCDGFRDGLGEGASVEVLAVSADPVEVRNAVSAAFTQNPEIEGVLAVGPLGGEPTIEALRQGGQLGAVEVGIFDLSPTILQALVDEEISFAIDQQQYLQGYLPIVFLTTYIQYGMLPANPIILTGPGFVTPENAEQVIALSEQGIR